VAVCAVVVVGCLGALTAYALASTRERVVSYAVQGSLNGVALDLADADVVIVRGGRRSDVEVHRTDRFAFGHAPTSRREVSAASFRLVSRCPSTVPRSCSASYRVVVPDSVSIDVRTTTGDVRLDGYRGPARVASTSGDISIGAYCGFSLEARAESGDIEASSICSPPQLSLRTTDGDLHAVVPSGRYRLDVETAGGGQRVRGITPADDAPFAIQALSSSGDVTVEGRR
jgi:hypothetical protein